MTDPIVLKNKNSKKNIVIGYVPEIHSDGEFQKIDVTKYEARVLIESWIEKMQDVECEWDMGQSSSWGIRMWPYANSRIINIIDSGLLTEDEVKRIFDKMYRAKNGNA
jgi:hypothetical protein